MEPPQFLCRVRVAIENEVGILVLDHHGKSRFFDGSGDMGDPITDLIGSIGKAAVADATIGMYRIRGDNKVQLKIAGRDIEDQDVILEWDKGTCCWEYLGETDNVITDDNRGKILKAIIDMIEAEIPITNKNIASYLKMSEGNVHSALGYRPPAPAAIILQPSQFQSVRLT